MKIQISGFALSKEVQFVEALHTNDSDVKVGIAVRVKSQEETNFFEALNISNEVVEIE